MKLFCLVLAICSFTMISCGDIMSESEKPQEVVNSNYLYGNNAFVFPVLTKNAKTYINEWGAYEDFESEAKNINGNTIEVLRDKSERLISRIDSLTKKFPDTLFTQSIVSRVMVAKTRASLLRQEVNKGEIDSMKLQNYLDEMNIATKNLIIQINEKFQKDDIDFQQKEDEKKELEKQKRFLDSVYKSELQDKSPN